MSEQERKIFDEPTTIDCNDCKFYWDSQCDGVPQGVEKRCESFLATRRVMYPEKIKKLETRIDKLVNRYYTIVGILVGIITWLALTSV